MVALLAGLRSTITGAGHGHAAQVFWAAALQAPPPGGRLGAVSTIPFSMTLGGGKAFAPKVMYAFDQAGLVVVFAAGGVLLGVSLIALAVASGETLPTWMRRQRGGRRLSLASPAFFPFFFLPLWSLTAGVSALTSARPGWTSPRPTDPTPPLPVHRLDRNHPGAT